MNKKKSRLIALDGDGVLFDYAEAYGSAWAKFTGKEVSLIDPNAYFAHHRWGIPWLEGKDLDRFKKHFDFDFWSTMPAIEGALEACELLVANGFSLVCVTALEHEYRDARISNLLSLKFPFSSVYTTSAASIDGSNPKSKILEELKPAAFVDDFLPYMSGISVDTHKALILRQPNHSPNKNYKESPFVDSSHKDLISFSKWWVNKKSI